MMITGLFSASLQDVYDKMFQEHIYGLPEISVDQIHARTRQDLKEVRVTYKTKEEFKNIAKKLGIMDDFKVSMSEACITNITLGKGGLFFRLYGQKLRKS